MPLAPAKSHPTQALHPASALKWLCLALAAAILTAALPLGPVPARADTPLLTASGDPLSLRLAKGKSRTIRTDLSFVDIVVGDPAIAEVAPLTDRSLYVLGKGIGTTSVTVYDAKKALVGIIEVEVAYDTQTLARMLRKRVPGADIQVSSINGRIVLSGTAPDTPTLDKAMTIANQYGKEVLNQVSINRSQQVMLEVRFLEASRSANKELGIGWEVAGNNIAGVTGITGLASGATPFGAVLGRVIDRGVTVDSLIQALERKGVARRLAEPNLVAMSGEKASFLAGGEFPFPVQANDNQISIEFKRFGIGLDFTPTVLSDSLINLKIEPEVSQLDPTTSVKIGDVEIPSLIMRRASTTVELRDGQSFVIAGLLQASATTSRDQLPWLGDVPVLGTLFKSSAYRKSETDLAIIITPHLVEPTSPGDRLRTPHDATHPANDVDLFLFGKDEVKASTARTSITVDGKRLPVGHIIDLARN
ncbi:MAG: secretin [Hyphomicrobiales bacterium]|nr:MAG: secretin [Hyphomicrobiales bacterium]